MKRSRLSLKWLEIFQLAARSGSVQAVAEETGLSISTVSHHLRSLQNCLGVDLLDHSRRPMVVTQAGTVFLRHIDDALRLIRRAEIELVSGDLSQARDLALGIVEDFDSEIAPELAQLLSVGLPDCRFRHFTRPSHEILAMLRDQQIDIGVATRPETDLPDLIEYPLLRDPFVLAVPARGDLSPDDLLSGATPLPFIRYSRNQMIGTRIEAQLRRLRITLPNRIEMESNQSIIGIVAEGSGWTITTPTAFSRARRFQKQVTLQPFPGKGFARYLSLFTTELYAAPVAGMIADTLRQLIRRRAIDPSVGQMPWLGEGYHLTPARTAIREF